MKDRKICLHLIEILIGYFTNICINYFLRSRRRHRDVSVLWIPAFVCHVSVIDLHRQLFQSLFHNFLDLLIDEKTFPSEKLLV